MDALAFLSRAPATVGTLYVLCGDEAFLKRQALLAIRARALGADADDQALSVQAGDVATFAQVFDELETLPFFFPRRLVVVDNADPFVTRYRAELERKVGDLPATGTLVLDVKTWPANTRLAKLVAESATIVCKAPKPAALPAWCSEWVHARHGKQIASRAAALLVELIGPEMGQLDQELIKLSAGIGTRSRIEEDDVDRLVGSSRAESVWKIMDAVSAGNTKEALKLLHRLFDQGDVPLMILGAIGFQLRKVAQAYRLTGQGLSTTEALQQAGVAPFNMRGAEQQMRHLGRRRLDRLYEWLVQINMDLRGNSAMPEQTQFERFIIKLARTR
jgi:DNA polymerase III subunit delta